MDEEWVSITEAAARLSGAGDPVDRSTLSRYVKQHAEALPQRREGKANLVEIGALFAHRGENVRLRGGAPFPAAAAYEGAPIGQRRGGGLDAPGVPGRRFAGTQADGAARKVMADAELREMELATRRRQLTPVGEVDRAGRDAVALMMSAFERAIDGEASSLSLRFGWDERTVRTALKAFARKGLDVFHRDVLERLDDLRRGRETDGEPTETTGEAVALQ